MLKFIQDGRQSLKDRIAVAGVAAPYIHAKAAARPYQPTEEERRQLDDSRRLVVEIVDFKEVD